MCPYPETFISLQGLKYSHDGLTANPWVDSAVVIHILWINMWINMLIACKRRVYVLGL
jgi:hypothetical protein